MNVIETNINCPKCGGKISMTKSSDLEWGCPRQCKYDNETVDMLYDAILSWYAKFYASPKEAEGQGK